MRWQEKAQVLIEEVRKQFDGLKTTLEVSDDQIVFRVDGEIEYNFSSNGSYSMKSLKNDPFANNLKRTADQSSRKKQRSEVKVCSCGEEGCIHDAIVIRVFKDLSSPPPMVSDQDFKVFITSNIHSDPISVGVILDRVVVKYREFQQRSVSLLNGVSGVHRVGKALFELSTGKANIEKICEELEECSLTTNIELKALILNQLGYIHLGIKPDHRKAFKYIEESTNLGNANSLSLLASCYMNGVGTQKDEAKSFELHQKAADLGITRSLSIVAINCKNAAVPNYQRALQYNMTAANRGIFRSWNSLAISAQFNQAINYDPYLAVHMYRIAAENGCTEAFVSYAQCIIKGQGIERNIPLAISYCTKACLSGNPQAFYILSKLYEKGDGVEENPQKALEYLKKAADLGHPFALADLGWYYEKGFGVKEDVVLAASFYKKALKAGFCEDLSEPEKMEKRKGVFIFDINDNRVVISYPFKMKAKCNLSLYGKNNGSGLNCDDWKALFDIIIAKNVKSLQIRNFRIHSIPSGLDWKKANLENVDLKGNFIKELPSDFALQTNVKYLDVSDNPLSGMSGSVVLALLANSVLLKNLNIGEGRDINPDGTSISGIHISLMRLCSGNRSKNWVIEILKRYRMRDALKFIL